MGRGHDGVVRRLHVGRRTTRSRRADGIEDTAEEARTYLRHEAGNHFNAESVNAFLDQRTGGDRILSRPRRRCISSRLRPFPITIPTRQEDDRRRAVDQGASPTAHHALGKELQRLRPPLPELTFVGLMIGSGPELKHFFNVTRSRALGRLRRGRTRVACARPRPARPRHAA